MDECKVVKVIYNSCKKVGSGKSADDPIRTVEQIFTLDGRLLAKIDVYTKKTFISDDLNPEN